MKTTRKCKVCKCKFEPKYSTLQPVCTNPACMIEYARLEREKELKKDAKDWISKTKEKNKTHGEHENDLQREINTIARLIDKDQNCISHDGPCRSADGGHYHSVGSSNNVRFNLFNVWSQCDSCNRRKGSNRTGYDDGLKRLFGYDLWLYINEGMRIEFSEVKLMIFELKAAIVSAREIIRELRKDDRVYSTQERIDLRKEINERIGIYINKNK
jgi:hypothetical protein